MDLSNAIYTGYAFLSAGALAYIWFVHLSMGANLVSYYYWTWFIAMVSAIGAWTPVVLTYFGTFAGIPLLDNMFRVAAYWSLLGPMVGYFVPHVILILAFSRRGETGLSVGSNLHFWLGWSLGMMITIFSIIFDFTFISGIELWYDVRNNPNKFVEEEAEAGEASANGPVVFGGS